MTDTDLINEYSNYVHPLKKSFYINVMTLLHDHILYGQYFYQLLPIVVSSIEQCGPVGSIDAFAEETGVMISSVCVPTKDWKGPPAPATGPVTSVGLSLPGIFNIINSPVTSSGVLMADFAPENANTIFAGPANSSGMPSFRQLVSADIPNLDASIITSGTLSPSVLGLGYPYNNTFLRSDGKWATPDVLSEIPAEKANTALLGPVSGSDNTPTFRLLVAADMPAFTGDASSTAGTAALTLATVNSNTGTFGSSSSIGSFTVNNKGLITAVSSIPIAINSSSISYNTEPANTIFAGPKSGSAAAPSFRQLVASDIPTLDQIPQPAASVSMNNQSIINLLTPVNSADAATKQYVDSLFMLLFTMV